MWEVCFKLLRLLLLVVLLRNALISHKLHCTAWAHLMARLKNFHILSPSQMSQHVTACWVLQRASPQNQTPSALTPQVFEGLCILCVSYVTLWNLRLQDWNCKRKLSLVPMSDPGNKEEMIFSENCRWTVIQCWTHYKTPYKYQIWNTVTTLIRVASNWAIFNLSVWQRLKCLLFLLFI